MKIGFFTVGSRGDVQPFVALAKGFAAAGHDVLFVADEGARDLVTPHGIPAHFLRGSVRERLVTTSGQPTWRGRDPYRLSRGFMQAFADIMGPWAVEAAEAMQGCKLLIMSNVSFGVGYAIAEKIRAIPCEASVLPAATSRYLPSYILLWPSLPLPGAVRRLLSEAANRAAWLGARDVVNAARRDLGVAEVRWPFGRSRPAFLDAIPKLYGFSPSLVRRPPDWPKNITITGFWHHRPDSAWQPPADLAAFLAAGPKPIYVGFGSRPDPNPTQLQNVVLRSIRRLGLRAVVSTGWGTMAGTKPTDDLLVIDDVPHEWLFPRVAAVLFHGGPGTVGAVLRAAVPSVIIPYLIDQPFWGWAMEQAGVAPPMISRGRLSVGRLTAALRRATTDEALHGRIRDMSARVLAEDGVRRAVETVEAWLSPTNRPSAVASRPLPVGAEKPLSGRA